MYAPLKIVRLILVMVSTVLIASFTVAASYGFRITIGTFSPYYSPKLAQIKTGTPISWENPTAIPHSIIHDGCRNGDRCAFNSGPIGPNGTFTVPNLPTGNYPYHCSFHPIMRGVLIVLESDNPSEASSVL